MYRVKLSETYSDVFFDFDDYGEAMGFVGIALETGHREGKRIDAKVAIVEKEVGLDE